jgi:hypothetical protein
MSRGWPLQIAPASSLSCEHTPCRWPVAADAGYTENPSKSLTRNCMSLLILTAAVFGCTQITRYRYAGRVRCALW